MVLAEGAADRRDGLADDEFMVVAELQRVQGESVGLDFEQGDVGEGVEADDLRWKDVAVGEFDEDFLGRLARALDSSVTTGRW